MEGYNMSICVVLLFCLQIVLSQVINDNNIKSNEIPQSNKDDTHDTNPLDDIVNSGAAFLQSNSAGIVGDMLSNMIQSNGGQIMENVLSGALQNPDGASQILAGISAVLQNNKAGAALDPNMLQNILSLVDTDKDKKTGQEQMTANMISIMANIMSQNKVQKSSDDTDLFSSLLGPISNALTDSGQNPLSLMMSSISSFLGPDAEKREKEHESHAYLVPPLLEKVHLYFDHFKHTEMYKVLWKVLGAEKIFNMFSVDGKFNVTKFFDRLENKNFRKHWINIVSKKITDLVAFATNSSRYEKYMNTLVSLFNGFLKSANFPKTTLFDIKRPNETLTKFFDYFFKKYLSLDVSSAQYVKPAVAYVKDIFRLAHDKGILFKDGFNSRELAQKFTDTLNLEIIEPVLRVWRAYRFAKKVPECDKYVMCVINQEDPEEKVSLPGLKIALSKSASMAASWFLSEKTGTSFWTLYGTIHDESDCSVRFLEKCNNFHIEESKIDSEYMHTEL